MLNPSPALPKTLSYSYLEEVPAPFSERAFNVKSAIVIVSFFSCAVSVLSALPSSENYNGKIASASKAPTVCLPSLSTYTNFMQLSHQPFEVGAIIFPCFSEETKTDVKSLGQGHS